MPAYSYLFHGSEYWSFKCSLSYKQYVRRFSESGDRFKSKHEAELAEVRFLSSLPRKKKSPIYFYDLYDDFKDYLYKKYRDSTATRSIGVFNNHIYPFFESKRISSVNDSILEKINEYVNTLSYKDPKNIFKICIIWIKFLTNYGIKLNSLKLYRFKSEEIINTLSNYDFYTLEEFNKFISVIDDPYWKLLFSCLYYYGLRISELRGIKKVNFTKDRLFINQCVSNRTSKYGQSVTSVKSKTSCREFPMFSSLYSLFLQIPIKVSNDYVFYSYDPGIMTVGESTIRRKLKEYCSKSDVRPIKIHEFRHSCASLLINNGLDSMQVASWLGHSSASITYKVYAHLFDRKKREIFDFLNSLQK